MSAGKQVLIAGSTAAAFGVVFGGGAIAGAIVGSSMGYQGHTKEEVIEDLRRMNQHCDLVGFNISTGECQVRLLLDVDEMPHETIVGRFAIIHERTREFRKYAMVLMKNWIWGDATLGTYSQVFLPFSSHKKARDFTRCFADKCKHREHWKGVHTYPCIVDLEDEELTILRFEVLKGAVEKLRAALFKSRVG